MSRRTIHGMILAFALLLMACVCLPGGLLSFLREPGGAPRQQPTDRPPATQPPAADLPVCVTQLDQVLDRSENSDYSGEELNDEYTLATYPVSGDSLGSAQYPNVPVYVRSYQEDAAGQQELWRFVTDVIPADQRTAITYFVVFTDGAGGTLGAVEQGDDPHDWMLEMDLVDGANFPDLSTTLIHEFGHLLTLNDSQVVTDYDLFNNPDDDRAWDRGEAACSTYFVFEGCTKPDSYLNAFFNRFWPGVYDQWLDIDSEPDDDVYEDRLDAFYQQHVYEFVTDYAVTSPEEDIAETFMYFIFTPKPSGATVAEQKILFFYEYPELVDLRLRILQGLCPYLD